MKTKTTNTDAEAKVEQAKIAELDRRFEFVYGLTMHEIFHILYDGNNAGDERLAIKLVKAVRAAILAFQESEPKSSDHHVNMVAHTFLKIGLLDYAPDDYKLLEHEPGCVHYKPDAAPEATPDHGGGK